MKGSRAKRSVYTDQALHSGAFYSQALVSGDLVFVSGQVPVDPESGSVVGETVYEQTCAVIEYLEAILTEADCSLNDVLKVTCYLTDLADFEEMNRAFERYFEEPYPTRASVGVQLIGFDVEMTCIARIGAAAAREEDDE